MIQRKLQQFIKFISLLHGHLLWEANKFFEIRKAEVESQLYDSCTDHLQFVLHSIMFMLVQIFGIFKTVEYVLLTSFKHIY